MSFHESLDIDEFDNIVGTIKIIDGLRDSIWKYVNEAENAIVGFNQGVVKKSAVTKTVNTTLELLSLIFPKEVSIIKAILPQVIDVLIEEAVAFGNQYVWNKHTVFDTGFTELDTDMPEDVEIEQSIKAEPMPTNENLGGQ